MSEPEPEEVDEDYWSRVADQEYREWQAEKDDDDA